MNTLQDILNEIRSIKKDRTVHTSFTYAVAKMVESNGGKVFDNLHQIAEYVNG